MIGRRITRYLLRETVLAWLAVTSVLVVVLLTNRLVRFMADAVSGDVPPSAVFSLLGLKALANLGTVLPASFFLGVILALGRLYRDSEMVAMMACGIGPRDVYRAVYVLAVPLALLVGGFSLWLSPWAERTAEQHIIDAKSEAQFQGVTPGRFVSFGDGRAVVYVGDVADDGTMREVFAHMNDAEGRQVVTAEGAHREFMPESGDEYLVLEQGKRFAMPSASEKGWRVTRFAQHGVRLDDSAPADYEPHRDGMSSAQLWRGGRDGRAELQWRLALPLTAIVLALIAVPLARASPREGRYSKLVIAVLTYIAYFNLLKAGQGWLEDGLYPAALGLWWVHAGFSIAGLMLLVRRFRVFARARPIT